MGLGLMVLITALFGACVAAFVALRKDGIIRATLFGVLSALVFAYLWGPIAKIGDPYFIESQLRLTALIVTPIIGAAVVGFWFRRTKTRRRKI
jgi:hypothetical protein